MRCEPSNETHADVDRHGTTDGHGRGIEVGVCRIDAPSSTYAVRGVVGKARQIDNDRVAALGREHAGDPRGPRLAQTGKTRQDARLVRRGHVAAVHDVLNGDRRAIEPAGPGVNGGRLIRTGAYVIVNGGRLIRTGACVRQHDKDRVGVAL